MNVDSLDETDGSRVGWNFAAQLTTDAMNELMWDDKDERVGTCASRDQVGFGDD